MVQHEYEVEFSNQTYVILIIPSLYFGRLQLPSSFYVRLKVKHLKQTILTIKIVTNNVHFICAKTVKIVLQNCKLVQSNK